MHSNQEKGLTMNKLLLLRECKSSNVKLIESRWSPNGTHDSPNGDGIQAIGRSSHKMIEAVMQSASKGKVTLVSIHACMMVELELGKYIFILIVSTCFQVQTIRQGYLSKRSSNLRGDWKRRFFVLDNRGMLYYYRKQNSRPSVSTP